MYTVYGIVSNKNDQLIYVGATSNLNNRVAVHKTRCINADNPNHHLRVYKAIRKMGGWDNVSIVTMSKSSSRERALTTERKLIKENSPVGNDYLNRG